MKKIIVIIFIIIRKDIVLCFFCFLCFFVDWVVFVELLFLGNCNVIFLVFWIVVFVFLLVDNICDLLRFWLGWWGRVVGNSLWIWVLICVLVMGIELWLGWVVGFVLVGLVVIFFLYCWFGLVFLYC